MFKKNDPHDVISDDRYYDKETGQFYRLDDAGKPIELKNPLTDPDYVPIDYSGFTGANWETYIDYSQD